MSERVKTAVLGTIEAVTQNPEIAKLAYQADTKLVEHVLCSANVREFDTIMIDEPAPFGGNDSAVSPVDLLMVALGSCQEIMYSALASVMDIPLESVSVVVKGNLDLHGLLGMGADKGIPPGVLDVSYVTEIKSSASEADIRNLVDAVENQCPVLDTLLRNIPVNGHAVINGSVYAPAQAAE